MDHSSPDPSLVLAWLVAHSIARGSPPPVEDCGGYRVDTHSESEVKRWVFPRLGDGVGVIARGIKAPRHYIKACASDGALRAALPSRWEVQSPGFFMTATALPDAKPLPDGYRMEVHRAGAVTRVAVVAPDGGMAASGCAAETADVFIYDRIETSPDHRRKGLGIAVMAALGAAKGSAASQQLLVATEDGRKLYERLGWAVLAPFSTALIPGR